MKVKKFILTICSIVILGLIIFYIPKNVNVEHEGIKYREDDKTYVEKTNVKVHGKIYKRLFKEDKFVGSFEVDGYDYTKNYDLISVNMLEKSRNKTYGFFHYQTIKNGKFESNDLGAVHIERKFEKIHIGVFEPVDKNTKACKGLVICAPAKSLEDALKITEEFKDYMEYIKR